jgi:protein TonB
MKERTQTRGPTNGSARLRVPSLAAAGGVPYDDPMSKVLGLDAKTSGVGAWFGFTSGGTLVFAGLIALASVIAAMQVRTHVNAAPPAEIDIQEEAPPPPPPPAETAEPEKPEPAPPAHAAPKEAPPPPPAPAQAAKVLTQEPDPNEPVDLTANTIVQGNADSYAGGFTASNGTNANAVRTAPSPTGVPGGTGPVQAKPAPVPQGPDRSRMAGPGNTDWSTCPFPQEADTAQIDDAYVNIQVDVRPDGTPAAVRILSDPGNGFGREARRCAMNFRFQTALDHDGNPIAGTSKAFRVHFSR